MTVDIAEDDDDPLIRVNLPERPLKPRAEVTVTNANPFAVAVELPIGRAGQAITADGDALTEVDGVRTWQVQVAPGDSATLAYRYE